MQIERITNQTFKGYSNVIFHDSGRGNERCLFIAAKLDNKDGHNDLEEYRAFKKRYNMSPSKIADDTIVMFYNKISPDEDTLFIGDEPLFWGEELEILPETYPAEEYKVVEDAHMKAYTLMSSLTKRIMEAENRPVYKFIHSVTRGCRQMFFTISDDLGASKNLVSQGVNNAFKKPHIEMQNAAKELNTIMDKTMQVFFK